MSGYAPEGTCQWLRAFYTGATTIEALVDETVGRVLDLFGIHSPRLSRWEGMQRPMQT